MNTLNLIRCVRMQLTDSRVSVLIFSGALFFSQMLIGSYGYGATIAPESDVASQLAAVTDTQSPGPVAERSATFDKNSDRPVFLQIAAFKQQQPAADLQRRLENDGLNKVVVIENLEGGSVYRVRIGPLQDSAEYGQLVERLAIDGITDTLLVKSPGPEAENLASTEKTDDKMIGAPAPRESASVSVEDAKVDITRVGNNHLSIKRAVAHEGRPIAGTGHVNEANDRNLKEPVAEFDATASDSSIEIIRAWGTRTSYTRRLMHEGIVAMQSGNAYTAENKFRQVLAAEPEAADASQHLFALLMKQNRVSAADAVAIAALQHRAGAVMLAKLYARSLIDRGNVPAALQVLEDHRPTSAGDPEYAALLAALLQQSSRHQEAAQVYEYLLTIDQRAGDWWVGLGIAQEGQGRRAQALRAFQRARDTSTISAALAGYTDQRIADLQAYD